MLSGLFIKHFNRRRRYGYCIDAPHIDVTDEQKSYLEKRLNKVDRLIKRPIYCRVTLDKEKMILLPKSTFLFRGTPSS